MRFKKGRRRRSRCFPLTSGYYSEIRAFEILTKLLENIDEKQPILAVVEFGDILVVVFSKKYSRKFIEIKCCKIMQKSAKF